MVDDPAVQSVRIAVALLDRFADLLKGPSQVAARKQKGALVGFGGNQDDLSLRIGEAQQVYPEIWRHLDEARTGFAARGVDVTAYDALRASEGQGLGAAPDTSYREYGGGESALQEHIKSANFNHAGFARARTASIALMRATPQIDWGAIAKAENEDPAVAAFGRATRARRWMWFGLLGIALASPFAIILYLQHRERERFEALAKPADPPPALSPLEGDDLEQLRSTIARLRNSLAVARATWDRSGSFGGLAAITAGTTACPLAPPVPPAVAAETFIRTGAGDSTLDASTFVAYIAGPDRKLPNRELETAEAALKSVEDRVAAKTADATDAARLGRIPHQVTIVIIDSNTEPEITQTAPMTYKPGEVTGRGYVFSLDTGTIACAGAISVRNPPAPEPPDLLSHARRAVDARDVLHRQLEIRIRQALASLTATK